MAQRTAVRGGGPPAQGLCAQPGAADGDSNDNHSYVCEACGQTRGSGPRGADTPASVGPLCSSRGLGVPLGKMGAVGTPPSKSSFLERASHALWPFLSSQYTSGMSLSASTFVSSVSDPRHVRASPAPAGAAGLGVAGPTLRPTPPGTSPSGGLPKGELNPFPETTGAGGEEAGVEASGGDGPSHLPLWKLPEKETFSFGFAEEWGSTGPCRDLKGRDGEGVGPPACTPTVPSGIPWCRWAVTRALLPPGASAAPASRPCHWGEVVGSVSVSLSPSCTPSPALWATGPLITLGRRYRPGVSSCPGPLACSVLTVGSRHHLINLSGRT